MPETRNTAVLLFDEVEVLDFAGPFEVFSVAGRLRETKPFHVYTVARERRPVAARNGLSVNPAWALGECPPPQVLVLPGGWGTRAAMNDAGLIEWIRKAAAGAEVVLSVCTGALLLARAGLLDGVPCTTHHAGFDLLEQTAPGATVVRGRRFVDTGKVVTSGGISAGIDASLHVVGKLLGEDAAREAAEYMEYRRHGDDEWIGLGR